MQTAIGGTEQECLPPIPSSMHADSEPEIASAPETETHGQPSGEYHDDAEFVLAGVG